MMVVMFFRFVLAKLMDRRSNAEEAVLIREECVFGGVSLIEQVELGITCCVVESTGDRI
jgi:hypothetical protein